MDASTGHRAAVALVVGVHETLGTTPAVVAGLAARPWTVGDLVAAALEEPETEAPRAVALAPRSGAAPARQTGPGRATAGPRRQHSSRGAGAGGSLARYRGGARGAHGPGAARLVRVAPEAHADATDGAALAA